MNAVAALRHRLARHPVVRVLDLLGLGPAALLRPVVAGALAAGSAVALIGVAGRLIARASQHPDVVEVSLAVVAVRALGISRGVMRYLERLASHSVALGGLVTLRERLYAALAQTDAGVVARLRRGDLLARWGADVDALADLVVRGLLPFPVAAVVGAATAGVLALVLPAAAVPLLVALLVSGTLAPWWAARAARAAELSAAAARSAVVDHTQSLLDGLAELEVAGVVPLRLQAVAEADRRLAADLDDAARPAAWAAAVPVLATAVAVLGGLLLGAGPAATGSMPAVWLAVLVLVPLAAADVVSPLVSAAADLVRGRASAERVLVLLDTASGGARNETSRTGTIPARGAALVARDLGCGWPGQAPVVDGFDLVIEPGRTVAVQGPSGCGKSTLLMTLAGLVAPQRGTVALGGTDLRDLDQDLLRRAVSYTAEDAHVFATTVRENLRVAAGDVPDAALVDALTDAGLGAWLHSLPDALDTLLAGDGQDVSGGERRRLLLARALLTGADVLLLDEPDEHLSPPAAEQVWRELVTLARRHRRAVVVVTHRPVRAEIFDEVVQLTDEHRTLGPHVHLSAVATSPTRW